MFKFFLKTSTVVNKEMNSFNHSTSVKIKRHLAELSVLLTNNQSNNDCNNVDEGSKYNTEGIDDSQIDKLYRLLRPMKTTFNHSNAIKLRLRQVILNQSIQINQNNNNNNNNGELIINQFEKIYDKLLKRNPTLLNHFLVIFYPFSFRTEILLSSSSSSSSSYINLIKRDNNNNINSNNSNNTNYSSSHSNSSSSTIHQFKQNQSKINRFVESSTTNSYNDNESSTTTAIVRNKENKIHIASDLKDNESKYVWLARELELKLLTDLIYILQVQ